VRIHRCAIVVTVLSCVFIAGCGGDEEARPVDLKAKTDTAPFKDMMDQQTKNQKGGNKAANAQAKP
jgi:hypothetical protein